MYFFVFSLFSKVPTVTACYFYSENTKASFETESTVNTKPVTSHKKGSDPRGYFSHYRFAEDHFPVGQRTCLL